MHRNQVEGCGGCGYVVVDCPSRQEAYPDPEVTIKLDVVSGLDIGVTAPASYIALSTEAFLKRNVSKMPANEAGQANQVRIVASSRTQE